MPNSPHPNTAPTARETRTTPRLRYDPIRPQPHRGPDPQNRHRTNNRDSLNDRNTSNGFLFNARNSFHRRHRNSRLRRPRAPVNVNQYPDVASPSSRQRLRQNPVLPQHALQPRPSQRSQRKTLRMQMHRHISQTYVGLTVLR